MGMDYTAEPIVAAGTDELPRTARSDERISYDEGREAHDNWLRATFACVGLKAYADRVGDEHEPFEATISDLLSDLMHLVDALHKGGSMQDDYWPDGNTFDDILDHARRRYTEERNGER